MRCNGEKKNRDSLIPPFVDTLLAMFPSFSSAHGKKLDDEQVGRGLNEVCAGCNGRWGWMNGTAGVRSIKQVD